MSTEYRRPIFWFLWPQPDAHAPVDGDYVQERLVRIPERGPVRVLLLALTTAGLAILTGTSIMAAIGTSWLLLFPVSALIATFLVLTLRGWSVGTYVNDAGIAVQRLFGTRYAQWTEVRSVDDINGRVIVTLRDGQVITTHIARLSADLLGSRERYDMAKLALERWGVQR
jgi:hypothetical protein